MLNARDNWQGSNCSGFESESTFTSSNGRHSIEFMHHPSGESGLVEKQYR
jgi:hypothetical protein